MIKPYNVEVELRTAHDVRKLAGCIHCNGMGDKNHMVPLGKGRAREYVHGRCYVAMHGIGALVLLPQEVTDRLRLNDIGNKAMKALMGRGR